MGEQNNSTTLPKYLPGLDGIRALAALTVLLCHALSAATVWSPTWTNEYGAASPLAEWVSLFNFSLGAGGVGLFFVLSGLCIHLPVARAMANGGQPEVKLGSYFKRRFRRIYPPHLIALLASIAVAAALPLASQGVHEMVSTVTLSQLAAHLALVHTFIPDAVYSGNHVLWSIAVEAHFYLLFPLILLARRRMPMGKLCLLLLVASVGLKLGGKFFLEDAQKAILAQSFLCRVWEWTLGCWVAERLVAAPPKRVTGLGEFFGLLGLALVAGMGVKLLPYGGLLRDVAWPLCFAWLIRHGALMPLNGSSLIASAGRASYSLYLVHPIALSISLYALRRWGGAVPPWQELAFGLCASAGLAWGFYRWVERPFMNAPSSAPVSTGTLQAQPAKS